MYLLSIQSGDSGTVPGAGLMDIDTMEFSHHNLATLGIDNDALDINDFMDENILKSKHISYLYYVCQVTQVSLHSTIAPKECDYCIFRRCPSLFYFIVRLSDL